MTEAFVSVDVETAGPVPGRHSLLALGACLVDDPTVTFYAELQPIGPEADPAALAVSRLSLDHLAVHGLAPDEAMRAFTAWVEGVVPSGRSPVLVAFNAPFDWMFVAAYFDRAGLPNPFGHSALDVKALYMGVSGEPWSRTGFAEAAARYGLTVELPHHAREDALIQAELFRRIRFEAVSPQTRKEPAP